MVGGWWLVVGAFFVFFVFKETATGERK